MSRRRTRNAGPVLDKEELSRELRRKKFSLLIQQFEKEAQLRTTELEDTMENMLATIDKVFKVEMMKLPPSLLNARMEDVIGEEATSASDVSIALRHECPEMHQPLKRVPSKRIKSTDSMTDQPSCVQKAPPKMAKRGNGSRKAGTLAGSNSTGHLGGASATVPRTQSRLKKTSEQMRTPKPKLRSVVSAGDLDCSVAGSAFVSVTTAQGQTVSFSDEKHINLDLLDDVAWRHIEKLTSLMENLSRQSRDKK